MLERRRGRVVAIASTAGLKGYAYVSAYSAAKHAVIGLVRSLALETAKSGVTVNAVCPGFVPTLMADEIGRGYMKHFGISKEQRIEQQIQGAPFKRLQQPEDIAAAIAFLASDDAREITGVTLNVNGGMSINM